MPRLLLLEDDRSLIDGLTYSLEKNGFETEIAGTVKEAEKRVTEDTGFDLLLFDVMLPDGNGIALCEKLRSLGIRTPIIFLTASDEETSVIRGLDCGGDDYITKPFKLGELCSRIRALLRRLDRGNAGDNLLRSGELVVSLAEGKVFSAGKPLELTGSEYRLLCLLLQNSGRVLPRDLILNRLWDGCGNFVDDNTLSVYIRRLREKLEKDPSRPEHLKTVRGLGYRWEE
ncbi:MAG: response regulator transcription factor [Lachnospiraceae bacterium]|jgi:two-component system response regulator RegX3|nr:response regulator transcription factor [Lachnospiraceae bacterium]